MIYSILNPSTTPYFKISLQGSGKDFTEEDLTTDVLGLTIEEKERELLTGSLILKDTSGGVIDKTFKYGTRMSVEWGIKSTASILQQLISRSEISGDYKRGPLDVYVTNCKDTLTGGNCIKNIDFRLGRAEYMKPRQRTFSSGTIKAMLETIGQEDGASVDTTHLSIASQSVTKAKPFIQSQETNAAFLYKKCAEMNIKFVAITNPISLKPFEYVFCDWEKQDLVDWGMKMKLRGKYQYFDYGNMYSNILDGATLESNFQAVGGSSAVPITNPDGTTGLAFLPSSPESTEGYILDENKVRAALASKGFKDRMALLNQIQQADIDDLPELKKLYFTKKTFTTAPEGSGFNVNFQTIFNPLYQIGQIAWLGPKDSSETSVISPRYRSTDGRRWSTWRIASLKTAITDSGATQSIGLAR